MADSLRTGDLATIDSEGYIYIVDRKSDFIKSYGNRVSSQEIESTALEINEVVSAAAVGIPDMERGETIVLFLTLRSGTSLTAKSISSYLKSKLPIHKTPSEIHIVESMPLNSNGKIMKSALRTRLEIGSKK